MSEKEKPLLIRENIEVVEFGGEAFVYNLVEGDNVSILEADRSAVALALLGGITPELVERCAKAYWETWHSAAWEECANQEDWRIVVRTILNEAFGVAAEGGD